jgi:hypothetical protein
MIRIEANDYPFTITADQFAKVVELIAGDYTADYDIVEGDTNGIIWLWVHSAEDADEPDENPSRHWIDVDGTVSLSEEVTWDWKGIQHDH